MLRLITFGGVRLTRGREALTGAGTQRRRLAILAVLAVAGERGLSREKLLGLLWGEIEEERARHTLNQLLYAQRQYFEDDRLFLGKKTLRLNPAVIWTDVAAVQIALDQGDPEEAARHYQGPFLDGFFLNDAPGFEEWADRERERFRRRLREGWSARAASLDQQGKSLQAAACWAQVAELDPLDSEVARKLAEALAAGGDRSGARRQARRHVALLKTELGVEPDPDFQRLLQRLDST